MQDDMERWQTQFNQWLASVARSRKMRGAVRERIAGIEHDIGTELDKAQDYRRRLPFWKGDIGETERLQKELARAASRIEDLVKEHAVLEGILDRRSARLWRWGQILGATLFGAIATQAVRRWFGGN
ncbi:hypothetical protein HPC49_10650 [Pyxidicoccus fallax]|uniref:Uncharacterized protein n=1 Tax=Pyxidicoccus fallax TaxID=394095 RepID=A0A848LHM8_9BACT|nr:hypothetical protein [Pyxidicoccus fallax]NMO16158.1 hypothetical protein [Pyxidicoccus fallax]NPC78701.1 hypothetical protein [Pyxidicoccus fallax]